MIPVQGLLHLFLRLHDHNPPLYALVTVVSLGLAGLTMGGLATGLLARLGAGTGPGKGEA